MFFWTSGGGGPASPPGGSILAFAYAKPTSVTLECRIPRTRMTCASRNPAPVHCFRANPSITPTALGCPGALPARPTWGGGRVVTVNFLWVLCGPPHRSRGSGYVRFRPNIKKVGTTLNQHAPNRSIASWRSDGVKSNRAGERPVYAPPLGLQPECEFSKVPLWEKQRVSKIRLIFSDEKKVVLSPTFHCVGTIIQSNRARECCM